MSVNYSHKVFLTRLIQGIESIVLNKLTFIIESGRELKGLRNFTIYIKRILLKELCYKSKFYRSRMMDRDHLDLIKISKNCLLMKIINLDMQHNQL